MLRISEKTSTTIVKEDWNKHLNLQFPDYSAYQQASKVFKKL